MYSNLTERASLRALALVALSLLVALPTAAADDAKERARRELTAAVDADDDLEPAPPVGMEARRG